MISIGLRIDSEDQLVCARFAFDNESHKIEFDLASRDDPEKNFKIRHVASFDPEIIDDFQAFIDAVRPLVKI